MRGHFKKRGASWYFWVELEPGPDGKRRQKSRGGFKTRKEAERAFAALRDEIRLGSYVEPSKLTLNRFLEEEWLPAIRASVRPSTLRFYAQNVASYIKPTIGRTLLPNVTAAKLNAFYATLLANGRTGGRGRSGGSLSPKTVRHVHTLLHKALNDAVRWGHLARNPASLAEAPRARTPEMHVWTAEQLRAFLREVECERLYAAWLLLITTGMRRGEVLGLSWENVDLRGSRLSVVRSLTVVDYQHVEMLEPKTAKGRRSVALDPVTVDALKAHRKQQLEERVFAGSTWQDNGLVFARSNGAAIHPEYVSRRFTQLSARAEQPRIRLHDLRHSYATAALSSGISPKVVSERLGHSSVSITLDVYSHVLPSIDEEAANVVASFILDG